MTEIQAVLFRKDYFTQITSKRWLKKENVKPIKDVHITKNYYRYRINEPEQYKKFKTKTLKKGIKVVLGFK